MRRERAKRITRKIIDMAIREAYNQEIPYEKIWRKKEGEAGTWQAWWTRIYDVVYHELD